MDDCCNAKEQDLRILRERQKGVLTLVLIINAVLFIVEATAGLLAHSTALLADSLDMFGDALVYGFSLYVLWRNELWKMTASLLKGIIMAAFGVGVLAQAIYKLMLGIVPTAETMGMIGTLVLLGKVFASFCSTDIVPMTSICVPLGYALATTSSQMSRFC
jgi:Co/Zn/Cd efflux system component